MNTTLYSWCDLARQNEEKYASKYKASGVVALNRSTHVRKGIIKVFLGIPKRVVFRSLTSNDVPSP